MFDEMKLMKEGLEFFETYKYRLNELMFDDRKGN